MRGMDGGIIRLLNALVISKSIKVIFLIWCLFVLFFININSLQEKKSKSDTRNIEKTV